MVLSFPPFSSAPSLKWEEKRYEMEKTKKKKVPVMAIRKLFVFSIFLSLLFLKIAADSSIKDETLASDGSDSPLKLELEQLKSKISVLGQVPSHFFCLPSFGFL